MGASVDVLHFFKQCEPLRGLGFKRGSYKCVCKDGFYFPYLDHPEKYFNGSEIENEYEKKTKVFYEMWYDLKRNFY